MRPKKILLIEEDVAAAESIKRALSSLGYTAISLFGRAEQILPQAKKEKPLLVLIDTESGGKGNGIGIAKRIQEELDIPVISIVAYSGRRTLRCAQKTEPSGYLLKPVNRMKLEMAIDAALCRKAINKRSEKRAKKALQESQDRYQRLMESISEGIIIQDKQGVITSVNEKFLGMVGYSREEVIGRPVTDFLGEGWLREDLENRTRSEENRWRPVELAWKRKDDKRVYAILSPQPICDEKGRFSGSVAVLTDITDRREVEMELRRSHEELRSLSQHLQSVTERESKRIAGEIHDQLGQQLTALKMDISWISSRVSGLEKGGKEILEKIEAMFKLIDMTIQTVQKISAELRPGLLDDLGLVPAIEWLAQDFQNRTKIECRVRLHCNDSDLEPDCSTAIFRISQEALTNITRHAEATHVDISLRNKKNALFLKISDNGKGIKESEIFAPTSLGLMGMRERVRPFGGELHIAGSPKRGTTLTVTLPLEKTLKND